MGKTVKSDYYHALAEDEKRTIAQFRRAGISDDGMTDHMRLRDIYRAMATLDDCAILDIWDTSPVFEMVQGYLIRAADEAGLDEYTTKALVSCVRFAMDDLTARDAVYIAEHYTG
jgi:hypothetical protein